MTNTTALFKATHGIVTFKIENQEYCTSLDIIDSIIKSKELNQLAYLSGERIIYKSEKYRLIDHFQSSKERFNPRNPDERIILISTFSKKIALIVDKIIEIIALDQIFVEKSLDFKPTTQIPYVSGILIFQDQTIYFPDYERIAKELSPEESNSENVYLTNPNLKINHNNEIK
jgi:chemotaxis signal transduction protein